MRKMLTVTVCVVLIVATLPPALSSIYYDNFTDFGKCTVYYSRSESTYNTFYEIPDSCHSEDFLLDFHFSVLSRSDAHILLSSTSNPSKESPVYEIVLGAGGNSFSDIRRKQKNDVQATAITKGILDSVDVKSFWIHIGKDGLVEIGKEGKDLAFLTWRDFEPLELNYFSFCTWTDVEAKWFFDCPLESNETLTSEEVEPEVTPVQRLRKDLLQNYNVYSRPVLDAETATIVNLKIRSVTVNLDEKTSIFTLQGEAILEWSDEKMLWDPEEYGGLADLHFVTWEIWKPDIRILNSLDTNIRLFESKLLVVNSEGRVRWKAHFNSNTLCNISDIRNWPLDKHTCGIHLFFHNKQNDQLTLKWKGWEGQIQSKKMWKILDIFTDETYKPSHLQEIEPKLNIQITIERFSTVYKIIFLAPYTFISFGLLAVFMLSSHGHIRMTLACIIVLMLVFVNLALLQIVPSSSNKPPYLVELYSYTFAMSPFVVATIIIITLISKRTDANAMSRCLQKFVTSPTTKKILLLADTQDSSKKRGFNNDPMSNPLVWNILGDITDRFALVFFFVLICGIVSFVYA